MESEEDAQTANFIGNIVGGYAVSSAASKFSLNKVKVDVPSAKPSHLDVPLQGKQIPKLDPANVRLSSRQDLHLKASPADTTLAKLKNHPRSQCGCTEGEASFGHTDTGRCKATKDERYPIRETRELDSLEPLVNGPYIRDGKPYGRPTLTGDKKLEFERAVYNKQVDPDGVLRDPNTGDVIDWKPGQSRRGVVDFGHKEGKTYKKMFEKYKNREITLQELRISNLIKIILDLKYLLLIEVISLNRR